MKENQKKKRESMRKAEHDQQRDKNPTGLSQTLTMSWAIGEPAGWTRSPCWAEHNRFPQSSLGFVPAHSPLSQQGSTQQAPQICHNKRMKAILRHPLIAVSPVCGHGAAMADWLGPRGCKRRVAEGCRV